MTLTLIPIRTEETNPHYDPERQNDGGGYSQPKHHFRLRGKYNSATGIIHDTSCGNFGSRILVRIGEKGLAAYFGSMVDEPESDFSRERESHRQIVELIAWKYGYRVPFKEDLE